jgi:hypothetical protein
MLVFVTDEKELSKLMLVIIFKFAATRFGGYW